MIPATGALIDKTYLYPLRVYYEDTDQQGIVFYANYLKFFERGRTEFLRHMDAPPARIEAELDRLFVVAKVEVSYHASAKLDEILHVRTAVAHVGRVKLRMAQEIWRDETKLCSADLTIAIINRSGKPARLPREMEDRFAALALD